MKKEVKAEKTGITLQKEILSLIVLCILLGLYIYRHYLPLRKSLQASDDKRPLIIIEIAGDVSNPGVYFFSQPPTLEEVLQKCGEQIGHLQITGSSYKTKLTTGITLRVIKSDHRVKVDLISMSAEKKVLFGIPLDLNTAKADELASIPGIGLRISQEIVNFRKEQGYFSSLEELKKVKGIGEKKFKKIYKYLTLAADPTK
ncbi:MAG: hypothetical protein DRG25_01715 [Deltaproteobacteria bacterium]|nr:MAG: hypothetical protein DRG25_01715 [Deltaproteobacteria bacterium]